ncbi:MAG: hypothetical protein ACFFF9_07290 [Candidatus Thorarchaeota archaeon]
MTIKQINRLAEELLKIRETPEMSPTESFEKQQTELKSLIEQGEKLAQDIGDIEIEKLALDIGTLEIGLENIEIISLLTTASFLFRGENLNERGLKLFNLISEWSKKKEKHLIDDAWEILKSETSERSSEFLIPHLYFLMRYYHWFSDCIRHFKKWFRKYTDTLDRFSYSALMGRTRWERLERPNRTPKDVISLQVEILKEVRENPPVIDWPFWGLPSSPPREPWIRSELKEGEDVTLNSKNLIHDFRPDIKITGYDTYRDLVSRNRFISRIREATYLRHAMFYRAIVSTNQKKMCLQYLWIFDRQMGSTSSLYMVIVPFLALIWTMIVSTTFASEISLIHSWLGAGLIVNILSNPELWVAIITTLVLGLTLFISGITPHISDVRKIKEGSKFRFRNTTYLIPVGLCIVSIFWLSSGIQEAAIIIFLVGFVPWFLETLGKLPTQHEMDYAPIFVWIKRKEGVQVWNDDSNDWIFVKAYWDKFHYYTDKYESEGWMDRKDNLKNSQQIPLTMDSSWHSFSLQSEERDFPKSSKWFALCGIIFSFVLWFTGFYRIGAILLSLSAILGHLFLSRYTIQWDLVSSIDYELDRLRKHILDKKDYEKVKGSIQPSWKLSLEDEIIHKHHLTFDKLKVLWNRESEEARLKIVSKLQDPFNVRPEFYYTFRDDVEYMIHDLISRVQELEERMKQK